MNNKRGSILVVTLGFILVFTMLGLGSMYFSTVQNEAAEKRTASTKAFWLSEAGLQKALWKFKNNNYAGFFQYDISVGGPCNPSTPCNSFTNCGSKEKCFKSPSDDSLSTYGDYDIVMDNFNSSVTSTGSYPSRTVSNPTQRTVMLDSGATYKYAFFAKKNMGTSASDEPGVDNNSCTDGYAWPSAPTTPGSCGGGNTDKTGRIGTLNVDPTTGQVVTGTAIKIGNGANIYGSVSTGPGGTVSNSGTIWVLPTTNTNKGSLKSVDVSSEQPTLWNMPATGVTINNTMTLGASGVTCTNGGTYISGTCYYKYTNINLGTNKTLTFQGPVMIYLISNTTAVQVSSNFGFDLNSSAIVKLYTAGKVILTNNGRVNNQNDKKPVNFEIRSIYQSPLSTKSTADVGVQVANNGDFYGTVYAPNTNLVVGKNGGGTTFFGAMVGGTIHVNNNTPQHFEKGLAGKITDSTRIWSECSNKDCSGT